MKYLCLIYEDYTQQTPMTKAEGEKMMGEYNNFTESIKASGNYLGGEGLQPTTAATTVRVRNGKVGTTAWLIPVLAEKHGLNLGR